MTRGVARGACLGGACLWSDTWGRASRCGGRGLEGRGVARPGGRRGLRLRFSRRGRGPARPLLLLPLPRPLPPPPSRGGSLTSRSRRCWTCTATTVATESSAETASTTREFFDIAGGAGGADRSRLARRGGKGKGGGGKEEVRPAPPVDRRAPSRQARATERRCGG